MTKSISSAFAQIEPRTKILFANVPADGHFNPLTGIAKHLVDIGCDVRWYTSKKYQPKIQKLGIPYYPLVNALDVNGDNIDEIFPERNQIRGVVKKLNYDIINFFISRGPEYLEDIKEIYQEFHFDLLIADSACTALPLVKEKLGLPVIAVSVFPLTETSTDLPPYGLGMKPSTSKLGRLKQDILRVIADKILFHKSNKVMRTVMNQYGIETGKSNLFDFLVKNSSLVLQSGTPGFEYDRSDMGKNVRFIGPLLPHSQQKERNKWSSEKLKNYRKVLLVTQGTVEKDITKLLIPTLEAFKSSEYLVIATTGGSGTQELLKRYPQENLIIEDFIPFEDIMPIADVYITNGGYGGVMLGIENKLPLVVSGIHEGKNEINARIDYFKLGIDLKKDRPEPAQIRKAVEAVMNNPEYRTNVEKLAAEFSQYDPNRLTAPYISALINRSRQVRRLKNRVVEVDYKIY